MNQALTLLEHPTGGVTGAGLRVELYFLYRLYLAVMLAIVLFTNAVQQIFGTVLRAFDGF